jgi:hypothetical protein
MMAQAVARYPHAWQCHHQWHYVDIYDDKKRKGNYDSYDMQQDSLLTI